MRLDWNTDVRDGITLVEVVVANDGDRHRRVRVETAVDGPVWQPRRQGVPESGWDAAAYTGIVAPGGVRPLGFATPAATGDPPVRIADTEVVDGPDRDQTATDVLVALGDPRPPRDAVVPPDDGTVEPPDSRGTPGDAAVGQGPADKRAGGGGGGGPAEPDGTTARGRTRHDPVPEPVADWLAAVARRTTDDGPAPADEPALDAVARRVRDLGGRPDRADPARPAGTRAVRQGGDRA
ncbi:MAG: hypothetical protein ABEJ08_00930 [Halobacteriaceae archaeon]